MNLLRSRKRPRARFPFPIVVLGFGRPDTLDRLLSALASQSLPIDAQQIHVVQDGVINPWSREKKIAFELSDAVYEVARRYLPETNVIRLKDNTGIGNATWTAYETGFETLDSEYAVFFEDDFLPGPHYLQALSMLHALMEAHPRIAFANALGQVYSLPIGGSATVVNQYHLWGALVSRRHWRAMLPDLAPYQALVAEVDFRDRPHDRILDWYRSMGLGYVETSQDCAIDAVASVQGRARINTRKAFGTIQRVDGAHMSVAQVDALLTAEEAKDGDWAELDISEAELDVVLGLQLDYARRDRVVVPELLRNLSPSPIAWDRVVLEGEAVRWCYRVLLGREPSAAEIVGQIAHRSSLAELRAGIMASAEFQDKAARS